MRPTRIGSVVAAIDHRAENLVALLLDAFDRTPALLWGAGASVPLVTTTLSAEAITDFVGRHRTYVEQTLVPRRISVLGPILGANLLPHMSDGEIQHVLEARATHLRLAPDVYKNLIHLEDGALQALLFGWLSPPTGAVLPGPHRAGYDVLMHVPASSLVITTNQDRLLRRLAPHLDVRALNGEMPCVFTDPRARDTALAKLSMSDQWVMPPGFVGVGQRQPAEVVDNELFWRAWDLTAESTSIVTIGYSFAKGLDVGCWDGFRNRAGATDLAVHVVDPDADHVVRDFAFGMSYRPPLGHSFRWNCLAYAILHLLRRYRCQHPAHLQAHTREIVQIHDELVGLDPRHWESAIARGVRGMRPKSFRG